jgi:Zn-dependent metalloprotease
MMAHYTFDQGLTEVKDILAHELTHSLMKTKDLNAKNSEDAINDAWTICFLY